MNRALPTRRDPRLVLITSPDPYKLQALVRREVARRSIVLRSNVVEVDSERWGVWVTQFRPIRPAWVRPVVLGGSLALTLGGAGALGWWLMTATAAVIAGASLAALLVCGALAATLAGVLMPDRHRGCETTVIVRHRH